MGRLTLFLRAEPELGEIGRVGPRQEINKPDTEGFAQGRQIRDRDVAAADLDVAEPGAGPAELVGEGLLGQMHAGSLSADRCCDDITQVRHTGRIGGFFRAL